LLFYHKFHFSGVFWGPGRYGRYQQILETFVCVGSHLYNPVASAGNPSYAAGLCRCFVFQASVAAIGAKALIKRISVSNISTEIGKKMLCCL
jgi:hypothetical protein